MSAWLDASVSNTEGKHLNGICEKGLGNELSVSASIDAFKTYRENDLEVQAPAE
jgi:hypothetical protein